MELLEAIRWWPLWSRLAWRDIKQRYKRTMLGPFWLTLSTGLMVGTLGLLWSQLWKVELATMLPFVSAGMIAWVLVTTLINEGCVAFTMHELTLQQLRFPYFVCVFRVLWRNLMVFFHNLLIQAAVIVWFGPAIGWPILLLVPGLLLVLVNAAWLIALLGLLCTRYRDVAQVIANILQIAMFVTPIFWFPEQAGSARVYFADGNIFFHVIELIREPLLGHVPPALSYVVLATTAVGGWLITVLIYPRYRSRIPFWV
jgi:ABC-type polysaccharide/polyol phosphate export permease